MKKFIVAALAALVAAAAPIANARDDEPSPEVALGIEVPNSIQLLADEVIE